MGKKSLLPPNTHQQVSASDNSSTILRKFNADLTAAGRELDIIKERLISMNEDLDHHSPGGANAMSDAETILEIINEPVAELDLSLRLLKANESFYKTFCLDKKASEGCLIYKLMGDQADLTNWEQLQTQAEQAPHSSAAFTIIHRLPDHEEKIFKIKARFLRDLQRGGKRVLIAAEASGEPGKKKIFYRKGQGAFKLMAENAPVMIWISDTAKKRIYFNKAWLRFTGRTLEEENGHGWESGIHPDDLERSLRIFHTAFDKRESYKKEYRLMRKDGEYRWILSQGVPFFKSGRFAGYVGSCIDINYRVELELQKDEFLSVVSHELKTPLTTIEVFTELLHQLLIKDGNLEMAAFTSKIDVQINKLILLIKEILDISRISGKTLYLNKELLNINKLVAEIILEKQPVIKSHQLVSSLKPVKEVLGDKMRLMQVLDNLISNAVKYSPDSKKVYITTEQKEDRVEVSVLDMGVGIPKSDQTEIFKRFFRAPNIAKTFPGIGLGLYISHEIIRRHKGRIEIESEEGKGSTFRISLPIAAIETRPEALKAQLI